MINLYPLPNANNPALGYNYVNEPVRKLNEGEFDIRLDHNFSTKDSMFARFSYDQATSFVPGGSPGFAEQSAFASTENIINHGRNAALSETHIFSPEHRESIQHRFQPDLRLLHVLRQRNLRSQQARNSGRQLQRRQPIGGRRSCGLTSTELSWLLVAGRSRIFAVSGRHQRLLDLRLVRHGARQPRHQDRRQHSRQPDECAGRRLPGRILGYHRRLGRRPGGLAC